MEYEDHTKFVRSYKQGDWILFYCTKCPDFEILDNYVTGEFIIRGTNRNIRHSGKTSNEEIKKILNLIAPVA